MSTLLDLIAQGGVSAKAVAGVGGLATLLSIAAIIAAVARARSTVVGALSKVCLALAVAALGIGIGATVSARHKAEEQFAELRPTAKEELRRQAHLEARANLTLALPLAAAPIVFALVGLAVASRRRWGEFHETPPSGPGLSILLVLAALGAWGAGAYLWIQPPPGKVLDPAAKQVMDLVDALNAGEWNRCQTTVFTPELQAAVRDLAGNKDNQRRCVDHFLQLAKREDIEKLMAASWIDDTVERDRLKAKLADLSAPPKAAEAQPDEGPLAQIRSRARACFEKAAKRQPKLKVDFTLVMTVSKAGKVVAARDAAGGKADPARQCVIQAAKALAFPRGEARRVEARLVFPANGGASRPR